MAEIRSVREQFDGLSECYEILLASIGSEDFGPAVRDAVRRLATSVTRLYLYEARGKSENFLHYFDCEPAIEAKFTDYGRLYLQLDPMTETFRAASRTHDTVWQRVRPSDIGSASFRRAFFNDLGIVERLTVVQRGGDTWRGMNLARHVNEGLFSDDEIAALLSLAGLVLPMLPLNRERRAPRPPLSSGQLEARLASRYPALPKREREVCARAALGMTVEATALDLGIGKTSVLTYRQRAYRRLAVCSPVELGALVAE